MKSEVKRELKSKITLKDGSYLSPLIYNIADISHYLKFLNISEKDIDNIEVHY